MFIPLLVIVMLVAFIALSVHVERLVLLVTKNLRADQKLVTREHDASHRVAFITRPAY